MKHEKRMACEYENQPSGGRKHGSAAPWAGGMGAQRANRLSCIAFRFARLTYDYTHDVPRQMMGGGSAMPRAPRSRRPCLQMPE